MTFSIGCAILRGRGFSITAVAGLDFFCFGA